MTLTPLDISKKEFRRAFRGYDCEEVDSFLEELGRDYGILFRDNQELREKMERMQSELERFNRLEQTLKDALVIAQQAAEEAKKAAAQQAENILKEAANRAQEIRMQAEQEIAAARQQLNFLQEQSEAFRTKIRTLLKAQLELLTEAGPKPE